MNNNLEEIKVVTKTQEEFINSIYKLAINEIKEMETKQNTIFPDNFVDMFAEAFVKGYLKATYEDMTTSICVFPDVKGTNAKKIIEQLNRKEPNPRVEEIRKRVESKIKSGDIIVGYKK